MLRCPSCPYLQVVFPVLASCVTILAPPSASMRHFIMTNYGRIAVIHACSYNVIICDFTRCIDMATSSQYCPGTIVAMYLHRTYSP